MNTVDANGKTPLHVAAACGHFSCLQVIVNHMTPEEVLIYDNQVCSALHWACFYGNTSCVEFLIKTNLFKKLDEGNNFSPIHCARFVPLLFSS